MYAAWLLALSGCTLVFPLEEPAPSPGALCSPPDVLTDDFEGEISSYWTPLPGIGPIPVVVTDKLVASMEPLGQAGIEVPANTYFDFREGAFSVDVTTTSTATGSGDQVALELVTPAFDTPGAARTGIAMRVFKGELEVGRYDDAVFMRIHGVPYDATAHRVWKIEQRGSMVSWSTSADGDVFIELQSTPMPFDVTYVRPRLTAYRDSGTPFTATFDRFNGGGTPRRACRVSALRDDFSSSEIQAIPWARQRADNCTLVLPTADAPVAGLGMRVVPNGTAFCTIAAGSVYDLLGGELVLEVERDAVDIPIFFSLSLETTNRTFAAFEVGFINNAPQLSATHEGQAFLSEDYDPVKHRFWRFRGEALDPDQQLIWEVSPDGKVYTDLFRTRTFKGLDHTSVEIGVVGTPSVGGTVTFRGLNSPP